MLEPLDEAEIRRAVESLLAQGVESLAICFLHAYANPTNERRAAELARELASELPISLSSEVLPRSASSGAPRQRLRMPTSNRSSGATSATSSRP